jgi:hypothetical protein
MSTEPRKRRRRDLTPIQILDRLMKRHGLPRPDALVLSAECSHLRRAASRATDNMIVVKARRMEELR